MGRWLARVGDWLLDLNDGQHLAIQAAVTLVVAVLYAGAILWLEK